MYHDNFYLYYLLEDKSDVVGSQKKRRSMFRNNLDIEKVKRNYNGECQLEKLS